MHLCLDLGTTTGFALVPSLQSAIVSGTWNCAPGKNSGAGMRFLKFQRQLDDIHAKTPLTTVHYEEVRRHLGTDAAHCYGGLYGVLTAWCEKNNVPYQGVPVQTIKKFWTGKGNAKKEVMIEAARLHGYEPDDDNEADAIALAHWVRHEMAPAAKRGKAA